MATKFQIKNGATIIEEVSDAISRWETYAANAAVSKESINLIAKELEKNL